MTGVPGGEGGAFDRDLDAIRNTLGLSSPAGPVGPADVQLVRSLINDFLVSGFLASVPAVGESGAWLQAGADFVDGWLSMDAELCKLAESVPAGPERFGVVMAKLREVEPFLELHEVDMLARAFQIPSRPVVG